MPESCCLRVGGELVDPGCTTAPSPGNAYLEGCYQLGMVHPDLCASIFLLCSPGAGGLGEPREPGAPIVTGNAS